MYRGQHCSIVGRAAAWDAAQHPLWALVQVPAAPLLLQLLAVGLGKAVADGRPCT